MEHRILTGVKLPLFRSIFCFCSRRAGSKKIDQPRVEKNMLILRRTSFRKTVFLPNSWLDHDSTTARRRTYDRPSPQEPAPNQLKHLSKADSLIRSRGGCQDRSKAQGSGPCPVGVRGFKSHPPHQLE